MSYVREDRPWLEGFNAFYEAEIAPLVFDLAEARATAAKAVWQRSIIVSAVAVPVEISYLEAHLQHKRRTKNGTHYVTVFKGPLLSLTFPKPFIGTTLVQTDRTAIGNFLSGKFTKGERVRLEDPEFEDQFEVYSTSQTEARFILTPDFMERMLILQRQMGKKLQAAFHDNDMLIAVNGAEDNFEAGSLDEQADPHAPILNTVEELRTIFDLIETLNLTSQTRAS